MRQVIVQVSMIFPASDRTVQPSKLLKQTVDQGLQLHTRETFVQVLSRLGFKPKFKSGSGIEVVDPNLGKMLLKLETENFQVH